MVLILVTIGEGTPESVRPDATRVPSACRKVYDLVEGVLRGHSVWCIGFSWLRIKQLYEIRRAV
jgi:hypothetical protein